MRRFAVLLLCLTMLAACGRQPRVLSAAVYTQSHGGPMAVRVTADEAGVIRSVELLECSDTPAVGGAAAGVLIDRVLHAGTTRVDAVAGATVTSMALLDAIDRAATEIDARLEADPRPPAVRGDRTCDVLVVGGGAAGLYAALTAARQGAGVLLCEKLSILGGSAAVSGGRLSLLREEFRAADTVRELRALGVRFLCDADALHYTALDEARGLTGGSALVEPLAKAARAAGAEILTDAEATDLITDRSGRVTGAVFGGEGGFTVSARAVVLCTGGSLPGAGLPNGTVAAMTTLSYGTSPVAMAAGIGAEVRAYTASVATLRCGDCADGILVNSEGRRFCDESGDPYAAAAALLARGETACWLISDRPVPSPAAVSAPTVEELAGLLGMDGLAETVARYNSFCPVGLDGDFGRRSDTIRAVRGGCYYAERRAVTVCGCVGGLLVDESGAVLGENGPIAGLYAAGEAANAIWFPDGVAEQGLSLAQVFCSAALAGKAAAAAALTGRPAEQDG